MGGNASTGLGSADHRSSGDMKSTGADDRPTDRDEYTNRKSLFPATKMPIIIIIIIIIITLAVNNNDDRK